MKFISSIPFICFGLALAQSPQRIHLEPEKIDFGKIEQGQIKKFELKIQNLSNDTLLLEAPYAQGIGPKNLKAPQKLLPKETAPWSFEYNSAYLKGGIRENITFVLSEEEYYSVEINGVVNTPITLSPEVIDLGYLGDEVIEKTIYALVEKSSSTSSTSMLTDFKLKKNINGISVKTSEVFLKEVEGEWKEAESGLKGLRVDLKIEPLVIFKDPKWKNRKSLNMLIEFSSKNFEKATPEIQVVGYKK